MLESDGSKVALTYFYPIMQGISAAIVRPCACRNVDKVFSYDVVVNTLLWLTSIPLEKSKKHWRRVGPR